MTRLSVNVNKIALWRNARGGNLPDLDQVVKDCERFGSEGITIHPRPDQRHIRRDDVYRLKALVTTEYNIEGYPSEEFLRMIAEVKPHQVTLVPDPPEALTSSSGWDTIQHQEFLTRVIACIRSFGSRVSLFVESSPVMVSNAAHCGADRIEFYTGPYAEQYSRDPNLAIQPYLAAAREAVTSGLGINAGHDLNLDNLAFWVRNIPETLEVSIGHALWVDALYFGMENTIQLYRRAIRAGYSGAVSR